MKAWVGALLALGAGVALYALAFVEITVDSEVPNALGFGLTNHTEVVNLAKLQARELTFHSGCALAIKGKHHAAR